MPASPLISSRLAPGRRGTTEHICDERPGCIPPADPVTFTSMHSKTPEAIADDLRSALEQIESVLADLQERAPRARTKR